MCDEVSATRRAKGMDLPLTLRDENSPRLVLIATDCWDQTNGITTLYRAVIRSLDEQFRGHCRLLIVHPASRVQPIDWIRSSRDRSGTTISISHSAVSGACHGICQTQGFQKP